MRIVIIVQARMTSTRLPGKILKEVMGKPLLEYQIERLKRVTLADDIVIATTENDTDLPIINLCKKLNINYFRGSEDDVLSRYYYAAKQYHADHVVRVTSDCPIIDHQVIDQVIRFYLDSRDNCDCVANGIERTYPRGMDTEIFAFSLLEDAFFKAKVDYEREHVTPYIYANSDTYKIKNYSYKKNCSQHRWTVDTPEDFLLIKNIIESLYIDNNDFTLEDCLDLLDKNPQWTKLNAHIEQKKLGE